MEGITRKQRIAEIVFCMMLVSSFNVLFVDSGILFVIFAALETALKFDELSMVPRHAAGIRAGRKLVVSTRFWGPLNQPDSPCSRQ